MIRETAAVLGISAVLLAAGCGDDGPDGASPTPGSPSATTLLAPGTTTPVTQPPGGSAPSAPTTTAPTPALQVRIKEESGGGPGWSWKLSYPEAYGSPATPAINAAVGKAARANLDTFVADTKDIPADQDPELAWTLNVASETKTPAPGLLVVALATQIYTGGAHGAELLEVHTFDARTGADLPLSSVFRPGSNYLQRFADEAPGQLLDQFQDDGISQEDVEQWSAGYAPTAENYAIWEPRSEGIVLTFASYQLGAYALGMPQIVVPWAKLSDIVSPNSPVAVLAK